MMTAMLDCSLMMAGRRPMAVWRMRGTSFVGDRLGPTVYGGWRVHCRCCQWDDWAKGPTHGEAIDTAYAHVGSCPKRPDSIPRTDDGDQAIDPEHCPT